MKRFINENTYIRGISYKYLKTDKCFKCASYDLHCNPACYNECSLIGCYDELILVKNH